MQVSAVNQTVSTFTTEMHSGGGGLVTPALGEKGKKSKTREQGDGRKNKERRK